jgi:hypothetical protein
MCEWESNSVVFNKRERAALRPSLVNISKNKILGLFYIHQFGVEN